MLHNFLGKRGIKTNIYTHTALQFQQTSCIVGKFISFFAGCTSEKLERGLKEEERETQE